MREIKFGFAAGEWGPRLWGRSDLEAYSLGAAALENFVVSYSGSAETRYPLRFVEFAAHPNDPVKLFPFESPDEPEDAFLVIFGKDWIRFVKDGGYVVDAAKTTAAATVDGDVNVVDHGYVVGDLVYHSYLSELTIVSAVINTATFTVTKLDGTGFTGVQGSGQVWRVTALAHAYLPSMLRELRASQNRNVLKITHPDYPPMLLTKTPTAWSWAEEVRDGGAPLSLSLAGPLGDFSRSVLAVRVLTGGTGYATGTKLAISPANTGVSLVPTINSGVIVGVTVIKGGQNVIVGSTIAVSDAGGGSGATFEIIYSDADASVVAAVSVVLDGKETGISRPHVFQDIRDITQLAGAYTFVSGNVAGAESYEFYRSIVFPTSTRTNIGAALGWIGSSRSRSLSDRNTTPDFTRTPRIYFDPFVDGQIISIVPHATVGADYAVGDTATVADATGTGAVVYPIVSNGEVLGYYIANPGRDYTAPSITVNTSTGSGVGAPTINVSPPGGNYPAISFFFQQRAGYAATRNLPATFWASATREFDVFAVPLVVTADSPFVFDLDPRRPQEGYIEIRHVLPAQQGLLVFTSDAVLLIRAGEGQAVTGTNAINEPQRYVGAAEVPPIFAGEDIIYVQSRHRGIELLSFNANARRFEGQEISLYSRHLFEKARVVALTEAINTENRAYGVFDDGTGFTLGLNREQQAVAFAPMSTRGYLEDCARVRYFDEDHIYFSVRRGNRRTIEYIAPYADFDPEDQCTLDGRISTTRTYPAAVATASGASGTVTVTTSAAVFDAGDVGKAWGGGGGRGTVTAFTSATQITVALTRPIRRLQPQATSPAPLAAGQWWMAPLVTTISGIPYEGQTVAVVADGARRANATVTNGQITINPAAAVVHVGFPFKARLQTLPPPGAEGKRINVLGAAVVYTRVNEVGLGVGNSGVRKETAVGDKTWNQPDGDRPVERYSYLTGSWVQGGHVTLEIDDGLPAEILRATVFYDESADTLSKTDRER